MKDFKLDIYQIISLLPVTPYHEIVHIFCSTGELSIPLGKLVYRGRLIVLDKLKKNLTSIKKNLKGIRLTNVKAIHMSDEENLKLKESSFDGTMISFALTRADNVNLILEESNRFMKNGAWLSLIDEYPVNDQSISVDQYICMAEKSGFHFHTKHNLSDTIYMILLRK